MTGLETCEHDRLTDKELGEQSEVSWPISQQKLVTDIKLGLEFLSFSVVR